MNDESAGGGMGVESKSLRTLRRRWRNRHAIFGRPIRGFISKPATNRRAANTGLEHLRLIVFAGHSRQRNGDIARRR
jgi:hypothetical protein